MKRGTRLVVAALVLALPACESPNTRPCLVETPREIPLSTQSLITRQVYTTRQVEIAMTQQTFDEMKEAVCQRADFFEGCASVVTLDANPPAKPRVERVRERVVDYMLAAALDLGRVTVRERSSGDFVPMIVAESFEDACSARHRVGRRYSLPGTSPFLEVRDL